VMARMQQQLQQMLQGFRQAQGNGQKAKQA
jgi:hypothetical protein